MVHDRALILLVDLIKNIILKPMSLTEFSSIFSNFWMIPKIILDANDNLIFFLGLFESMFENGE